MANKKRLIWDEDAKRHLIALAVGHRSETLHIDMILNAILRNVSAVDAVEVVHGRWVEWYPPMHMILTGEELLYRCSACDAKYPDVEGYRYCPHCGAFVDGERKDNEQK